MSVKPASQLSFPKKLKIITSIVIISAVIVLVSYILFQLGKNLGPIYAEQSAIRLSESIPAPSDAIKIKNWSGTDIVSLKCYVGYAHILYGSNFQLSEVTEYYKTYVEERGWSTAPETGRVMVDGQIIVTNEAVIHVIGMREINSYNIEIAPCTTYSVCNGFSLHGDFPSSQEDKKIFEAAQKQYKTAFLISVVFIPDSNFLACKPDGG